MLGGDHAHLVAHVDQVVVARAAEHLHGILAGGPQFVVARHPDDLGEPLAQQVQRPADLVGALGDVARDDQPVVRRRRMQRLGDRLVAGVTGVQVADRPRVSPRTSSATCARHARSDLQLEHVLVSGPDGVRGDLYSPRRGRRSTRGCHGHQDPAVRCVRRAGDGGDSGPAGRTADRCQHADPVELRSTSAPLPMATTTIKWPVVETSPIPIRSTRAATSRSTSPAASASRFTPPEPQDGLRCHYDAGNYQMAVEAFVWRTYEEACRRTPSNSTSTATGPRRSG